MRPYIPRNDSCIFRACPARDLSYLLDYGGVFEPLRDVEYFRRLRADGEAGTIVWPNEADIAPETLYAHARRQAAAA